MENIIKNKLRIKEGEEKCEEKMRSEENKNEQENCCIQQKEKKREA